MSTNKHCNDSQNVSNKDLRYSHHDDICVMCGDYCGSGRMVCTSCENKYKEEQAMDFKNKQIFMLGYTRAKEESKKHFEQFIKDIDDVLTEYSQIHKEINSENEKNAILVCVADLKTKIMMVNEKYNNNKFFRY